MAKESIEYGYVNASKIRGRFKNTDSVGEQYYAYLVILMIWILQANELA